MMQKVLIASNFGGNIPDIVSETMLDFGNIYPQCRVGKITEWIENTADEYSDIFFGEVGDGSLLNEYLKDNKEVVVHLKDNQYAGWCTAIHHMTTFSLEEVNVSKPWTIREYDGKESACNIPQYKCIDEGLNLYEEVREDEYEDR